MPIKDVNVVKKTQNLDDLYPVLSRLRMTPGWNKIRPSLWKEPKTQFAPMHWSYETAKAALDQAGKWIGTELAERRNFLLFNPVEQNEYDSVRTMVVAYQMIKPGEHARAHWHSPNAMRLILEAGPGCYTVVNGVKLPMKSGDFLLTPGGCWHSHFNEGDSNAYWIDFLDVPLVHLLEPMFAEEHPKKYQDVSSEPNKHPFYFPKEAISNQLSGVAIENSVQKLSLPISDYIKTMGVNLIKIQAGISFDFKKTTESSIVAVLNGHGSSVIADQIINWSEGDVIAVPSWKDHVLTSSSDAMLVQVTDKPLMQNLGFYRTE